MPSASRRTKPPRLSEDTVARIFFAQGNQQGRQLPLVTLDDRQQATPNAERVAKRHTLLTLMRDVRQCRD
jgi:hypothetical protein